MTPEQEQWLIRAIQELQASQQELKAAQQEMRLVQQNQQLLIQELREGQAMLAQFFREALDRFDERTRAIERRTDEMAKEMREMRQEI
ncbi:hypothetical protein, partial [Synechococcus sp. F70.1]|uniref:hypothetical protein n=1 Tax=Synechococcus sp. F70.1 TaxID=2964532 RepID=UPI0039C66493